MRHIALSPSPASFGTRSSAPVHAAAIRAHLRRWRRRASVAAIARAISDLSLNPYLFQIDRGDRPRA
jgi:hypothetical protein